TPTLRELIDESLQSGNLDDTKFIYMLEVLCALDGDEFWGSNLNYLADGELPGLCHACRGPLYFVIGERVPFATAELMWMKKPDATKAPISPCTPATLPPRGQWVLERALSLNRPDVARMVGYLFGSSICLSCGQSIDVEAAFRAS